MRQILSTAITALIVAALTAVSISALAQSEPEPALDLTPSATVANADKVDGKHAVSATGKRGRRAGKLVATNKNGWLPSNIVKPKWNLISNKPAGFADGVDDQGVTGVMVTTHSQLRSLGASGAAIFTLTCPAGTATGGGWGNVESTTNVVTATPYDNYYFLYLQNTIASADSFYIYVSCLTVDGAAVASRLTPAAKAARPRR